MRALPSLLFCLALLASGRASASGGPLGIDHRIHYDNSGIWKRSNQNVLIYGTITTVVGGALVFGDQDKLGDTFWRSVDALTHAQSFPSGEVAAISAAVTPFMVNYGHDHPAVYALALLPVYDAIARVKTRGHWQSDVLVGAALGTGVGLWASHRNSPLIIGWLPGGFQVGFIHHFK